MKNKKTLLLLAAAVVLCLVSALVQSLVISGGGAVRVVMLKDAANTSVIQVNGEAKPFDGLVASGALFVPKGASETNKLPAVILTHGYLNDWQKQYQNAIELSRRGFVVLAVDRAGHGENTQPIEGSLGYGGTTADSDQTMTLGARYLYNLPYVDRQKIGISGHSMGGFATSMALMKDAQDTYEFGVRLFAAGLQQAWETSYGVAPGVPLGILKSNDDEFFFKGVDPASGQAYTSRQWLSTSNASRFVGVAAGPVASNHIYLDGADLGPVTGGQAVSGGFRVVYEANEIHTLNHFSRTSAANVVNFFYTALGVPSGHAYIPETSQIWWLKEAVGVLGIIGFYLLLLPLIDLLLAAPLFASLRRGPQEFELERSGWHEFKGMYHWASLLLVGLAASLIAGFALRPVSNFAAKVWHVSNRFPQEHSNWLAYWCMFNGLVLLALLAAAWLVGYAVNHYKHKNDALNSDFLGSARPQGGFVTVVKAFLLAACAFAVSLLFLAAIDAVFHVDFRLWLYTVKSISIEKLPTALRYLPVFFVFYGVNAWNASNTHFKNMPEWLSTLLLCVFNCLGLALIFGIQYFTFKSTGVLWHSDMGTRYPTLLTVMPILCVATIYSKKLYRRTGNCWVAAFLTSLIATCACVGGASASMPYTFL